MKVIVYPHTLEIGGSQLNAIELAAAVRARGADVTVFAQPGVLLKRIHELGLDFVEAPPPWQRPSAKVMRSLCGLVRERDVDVIHGYEWTTVLEAYWGPKRLLGTPVVGTVMSMAVAHFFPRDVPLIVGTEQIAEHERLAGRPDVELIEPPVDVLENDVNLMSSREFRARFGLSDEDLVVVSVSRLAEELKLEGLLAAIETAGNLAATLPLRLVIVGDGPAAPRVRELAAEVNSRLGREVVVLTGELFDPRPAYAAADVCLGMGGSALRAMAFGKPLIVQGEKGFWKLLTPETVDQFLWTGWYGVGAGATSGPPALAEILVGLAADSALRDELGRHSRELAVRRFSLESAAERQMEIYHRAIAGRPRSRFASLGPAARSGLSYASFAVAERLERLTGSAATDDFNARPVAVNGSTRAPRTRETVPPMTSEEK